MSNNQSPATLDRLLDAIAAQLSPAAAREVADLHAPEDVLTRLDALAEKTAARGELEPDERLEYEGILQIAHVITLIQSRLAVGPEVEMASSPAPAAVAPISRAPRTIGAGRNLSKLAGLQAMLDDLDRGSGA